MKFLKPSLRIAAILPVLAGFFVIAVAPRTARAASDCTITQADLAALQAAQAQGLSAELAARKGLLTRTITCAKNNADQLQSDLNALKVGPDDTALQARLSGKLDDAKNYYDLELAKIGGVGLAGTRAIAREVLDWRASNYAPLAGQVSDFEMWEANQQLFATAKNRLDQMRGISSFIQQAAPNNDLQTALASAEALMQTAEDQNASAKDSLLRALPPDQSLALIKQSLKSLSDAYGKFFTISTMIQALLETKPPAVTQ